jgi:TRAP-type C4-dicarboxylate transport system substrate-binding protein
VDGQSPSAKHSFQITKVKGGFKMKSQKILFLFISIFIIFFFSGAYAKQQAKPVELKFTSWMPPQLPFDQFIEKKWGKMVEEKSNGSVKIKFYWSGSLVAFKDTYRAVQTGVADIGYWVLGSLQGVHTLNEFTSLPLMGWDSTFTATKVYHEIQKKFPELDAEFQGLTNLFSCAMPPNQIHMINQRVRVPEDIHGMKILAAAGWSDFINTIGAVSVFKGPQDWYMSLQKGLVDGQFQHWPAVDGFKITELFSSHTHAGKGGFGTIMHGFWMNSEVFNKLPPEAQKAFMELKPWAEQEGLKLDDKLIGKGRAAAEKMGHEMIDLTAEEIETWIKATEPVREKWVATMESKGKPGKAIYDEAQRLISIYNK